MSPQLRPLSPRERECLALATTQHLSTSEVAVRLGTSYHTVRNHIAAAMLKAEAVNRYDAAERYGIISAHEHRPVTSCSVCGRVLGDRAPAAPRTGGEQG